MCVLIAKYFPGHGWVAVKNRDRNYTPEISFNRYHSKDGVERLLFEDDITNYCEGINSNGVSILSASLMVLNDEKEIEKRTKSKSSDGEKIKKSLLEFNAIAAAHACIQEQLTGNTLILDANNCFLLEGSRKDGKFRYKLGLIPKSSTVARTNHGIWMPWAGYQRGIDENQTLSRISSEARLLQAQFVVESAQDPEDMIDGLAQVIINHPQLNVMRMDTKRKKMRTTAQEMVIPKETTLFCRPISSHMTFDFWKLNRPDADTWVEILSNRVLYQKTKAEQEPPFDSSNWINKHWTNESASKRIYQRRKNGIDSL